MGSGLILAHAAVQLAPAWEGRVVETAGWEGQPVILRQVLASPVITQVERQALHAAGAGAQHSQAGRRGRRLW